MGNYEVGTKITFSSAHRLVGHDGPCKDIHGHNWTVEAVFSSEKLDRLGMVVDFNDVKKEMNRLAAMLDHKLLNDVPQLAGVNPTAENLAEFFFKSLEKSGVAKPALVRVFETDDSWASFSE
ncbi:MAG: 6-carboxytetrahydropterin synthase QueD [Nitrospinae bacterium]|nr:6-carboxytetrahydropterin synthase QueD [Nitrospinota bacterium]